ncbi:DnaD domain protein [Halobacillus sp. GSS1]|uniref:DnaD domain protein n=1 Tax=Halobacillus sp. GSS1 TaxID=2815919 RepID=UPI001F5C36E7|nr:DnaD domain protein [Halobacillus sp. GSS1]
MGENYKDNSIKEKVDQEKKVKQELKEERTNQDKNLSKEEQFINMLEQISPRELLEDVSQGNRASTQDLNLIRNIMTEQKLSPGVMNVLIHYVLLKTNMSLSKPFLEKIASHWKRKNVESVRQAMNLAKEEHQKYMEWTKGIKHKEGNDKVTFEEKYIYSLYNRYGMKEEVSREVIEFSREINQGFMIYWFMNRVAEFLNYHNAQSRNAAQSLLRTFYQKYIDPFGRS